MVDHEIPCSDHLKRLTTRIYGHTTRDARGITKSEMAQEIRDISLRMAAIGCNMDGVGQCSGDMRMVHHEHEMISAAKIAQGWADGIDSES